MRVLLAIFLLASGFIGLGVAFATDEPNAVMHNHRPPQPHYNRYFPATGAKPKIGRAEDLEAHSIATPERDNTYRRNY
jgi:hypothetical protein